MAPDFDAQYYEPESHMLCADCKDQLRDHESRSGIWKYDRWYKNRSEKAVKKWLCVPCYERRVSDKIKKYNNYLAGRKEWEQKQKDIREVPLYLKREVAVMDSHFRSIATPLISVR